MRRGDMILASSLYDQITFKSKHEAARELAISRRRLETLLETGDLVRYNDKQYCLEEHIK